MFTAPLRYPKGQRGYLAALKRADWVQDTRVDGRDHLLAIARVLALTADWDTLETWPGWDTLRRRTGLSETTIQRWLQELKVRGWIVVVETGSTPLTRPMALRSVVLPDGTEAFVEGNRRAVYALRIPLSPDEAITWAAQTIAAQAAEVAARAAEAEVARRRARAVVKARGLRIKALSTTYEAERCLFEQKVQTLISQYGLDEFELVDPEIEAAEQRIEDSLFFLRQRSFETFTQRRDIHELAQAFRDRLNDLETAVDQGEPVSLGEEKGWPTCNFPEGKVAKEGGYAREAFAVDDCGEPLGDRWGGNDQQSALRARSDENEALNWASTVPTTPFQMLCAVAWLQQRLPIFARLTRFAVRALCRPLYAAGWSNLDIVHAMDHLPGAFGVRSEKPNRRAPEAALGDVVPGQVRTWRFYAAATNWIRTRLDAWRDADGRILRGYYQDRGRQVAIRKAVAQRHGRAGVQLLQHGGLTADAQLTADTVAAFGRKVAAQLRRDEALNRPAAPRTATAAASEQARDQARKHFETAEADRRTRAAAQRHEQILASHSDHLEKARAELAAATGTPSTAAFDLQLLAERDALTRREKYEQARTKADGHPRTGSSGYQSARVRRRWSR
ncbi:hypothetical protein [Amycolatopsis thailandensis]|uniref:hypothetical protein n=1 Tax=Amycolatopsis thailandensis TaxID=589330 RepID=UPI0036305FDD